MDPGVTHYALWTLLETVNWSGYISNHFYEIHHIYVTDQLESMASPNTLLSYI